jgi:predicted nuclease of predicted toxin-antitoxin system
VKILADEGVDRPTVERLRQSGHQVWYVAEMEPGISDETVLDLANREEAVLLTADKDFGELVSRQGRMTGGIILIRLAGISPARKAEIVASALAAHGGEMAQAFTVITPGAVRIRHRGTKLEKEDTA